MEEKEKKVEEKTATHKKKAQLYILLTAGAVAIVLFLNFVFSAIQKKSEVKLDAPIEQKTALKAQELKSILNDNDRRRLNVSPEGIASSQKNDQQPGATGTVSGQGNKSTGRQSPYTYDRGANSTKTTDQNSPEKIRERFEADEINRALRARYAKDHFSSNTQGRSPQGNAYADRSSFQPQDNSSRISAIDQEKSRVNETIRALEERASNYPAEREAKLAMARDNITSNPNVLPVQGSSTGNVPQGIVGYSQKNAYQASTEGMIKLYERIPFARLPWC